MIGTEIKKIALYARVSTEEQAEEGFSINAQLDTLRAYAKQNHYIIYNEYVDEGISGKSIVKRKALKNLLEDAKKGLFQEVIVWKINRISRNQLDLLQIVDTLNKNSVSFRSYSENFETETPMGRFALQMMGSVAELERNTIIDNVKLGMKARAKQGKWNGGAVLGYKSIEVQNSTHRKRKETHLEIIESEANIVKMIFEKYANSYGFKAIANELNHLGYKTKRGGAFSVITIKGIITNPIYYGKIYFNRNHMPKHESSSSSDVIMVEGEHDAIISEELWDKVQAIYSSKNKKPSQIFYGSFPFTGVMRCPVCGYGMVAHRATRKGKNGEIKYTLYYQCGNFANKGSAVCHANSVRADYAEHEIISRLQNVLTTPKLIADVTNTMNKKRQFQVKPLELELKHLTKELSEIERKKEKYFKLYEEDVIDPQELKIRIQEITETYQQLFQKKSDIETQLNDHNSAPVSQQFVKELLSNFVALFEKFNHEQRKQLVHATIKQITITPDRKIDKVELKFDNIAKQLLSSNTNCKEISLSDVKFSAAI